MNEKEPDRTRSSEAATGVSKAATGVSQAATGSSQSAAGSSQSATGVPEAALSWQFVRAGGPGGQNVNKVASAVQLRVDLDKAGLPPAVRQRLEALVPGQITQGGELIIAAQRFRSQLRNREDALQRLANLLGKARREPARRIRTRPSAAQKRKRQADKKQRGALKKLRDKPILD